MIDEVQLMLFLCVLMRMSGFVAFNPLLGGRNEVSGMIKAGMAMVLAVSVYATTDSQLPAVPTTVIGFMVTLLLELALGYLISVLVQFFFYVVLQAGQLIDMQMGTTMAETYDPSTGASMSITGNVFNILMMLVFFAGNGHITLLQILTGSGGIIPFGTASLGPEAATYVLECFASCAVLALKLSLPLLAVELLGQLGMGVLMKVIPQINVFAINFEFKLILGFLLVSMLLPLSGEFIIGMEKQMLVTIENAMEVVAG